MKNNRSLLAAGRILLAITFVMGGLPPVAPTPVAAQALEEDPIVPGTYSSFEPIASPALPVPRESRQLEDEDPPPTQEESAGTLQFDLVAEPGVVAFGDEVTFQVTIRNESDESYSGLVFTDLLEAGFQFVPAQNDEVTYDRRTNMVSRDFSESLNSGESIEISYTARVTGSPKTQSSGELWVHNATLIDPSGDVDLRATAELLVGGPQRGAGAQARGVTRNGGWARTEFVSIYVPPGTLDQDAIALIEPVEIAGGGSQVQFHIELRGVDSLQGSTRAGLSEQKAVFGERLEGNLPKAATLQVNFDEISDLDAIPLGMEPFVATYDEDADVWIKIPLENIDYENNSVSVQARHFSTWGAGLGDSLPQNGANVMLFDDPYVSLFSGKATFSYPIWTPPGRIGMSPSVGLSYSSGTVDGLLGDIQASWVGMGWNIDGIEVVRQITSDENGYGYENEFALTLNGTKYELVQDETNPSRYETKDASFLYIEHHNPVLGNAYTNRIEMPSFHDPFAGQELNTSEWTAYYGTSGSHTIEVVEGGSALKSYNPDDEWGVSVHRSQANLTHGKGITVKFRLSKEELEDPTAILALRTNDDRWGIYISPNGSGGYQLQSQTIVDDGSAFPEVLISNFQLDAWYVLQLVVDDVAGFHTIVWEQDHPLALTQYHQAMPTGQAWRFFGTIRYGSLWMDSLSENNMLPQNTTHEWWEVASSDGTRYRLGWNEDSEQLALMDGYSCTSGSPCTIPNGAYASLGYAGEGVDVIAWRWRADRVLDAHGNYMESSYAEEVDPEIFVDFDHASYLKTIKYTGFDDPAGENDLDPAYCINFVVANRPGDNPEGDLEIWDNYDTQLLDKIEIRYDDCTSGTIVRTYDLKYEVRTVPSADGTLVLKSIATSGGGYTEDNVTIASTAAATIGFTYTDLSNTGADCPNCEKWVYPRIIGIDNGYGASLSYLYDNDDRGEDYWYNWRIAKTQVNDGMSLVSINKFTFEDPLYTGEGSDPNGGRLIGYTYVTETRYEFNGTTKILDIRHCFGTEEPEVGREYWTKVQDPDGTVLRKTVNTYTTDDSFVPEGGHYTYLSQTDNYQRVGSALKLISGTRYDADPTTGNLVEMRTFLEGILYNKTQYEYSVNNNPDVWMLDQLTRITALDRYDHLIGETRNLYNEFGDLILIQKRTGVEDKSIDTSFIIDAYGNRIEARVYSDYGTIGDDPRDDDPPRIYQAITTVFDDYTQTYSIATTQSNQTSTVEYIYTLGVPSRITDANNDTYSFTYDGLGRKLSSTAPGFSSPTLIYTYPEPDENGQVSTPYSIKMQVLDTLGPSADTFRSAWAIYDGLGRIRQNQVYDADSNKLILSNDVSFNAQGLVELSGVPHSIYGSGGTYHAPIWSALAHTITEYDLLGRVVEVTQPGERVTQLIYEGLSTSAIDPNGHKTRQEVDGLGRLIYVREYTGVDPDFTLYASTDYSYDYAGNLTMVEDEHSNRTLMDYDWLGRKTYMLDPDMGDWTYEYDPQSNLIKQTDARNQVINMEYDDLKRLTRKYYMEGEDEIEIVYAYGTDNDAIGRRVSMTEKVNSIQTYYTSWSYNNDMREVEEVRDLGDYNFRTTSYTDWLGRVESVKYELDLDGITGYEKQEIVSYDYDALGRTKSMDAGSDEDLISLTYNTIGQITITTLDNGVNIQNCYEEDTFRLLSRRAFSGSAECSELQPGNAAVNFTYSYDPVGNITAIEDFVRDESFEYTYDELDRLTVAEGVGTTDIAYRDAYEYDEIGNITRVSEWNAERLGTGYYEEDDYRFWYKGSWSIVSDDDASSDAYIESAQTDAFVRVLFTGTGFYYVRPVGPDQGIVDIYSDGLLLSQIDNYDETAAQQSAVFFPLSDGDHLLELRVSGEKNELSSGKSIGVDAIEILSDNETATPTVTDTSTPTDTSTSTDTPTATDTPTGTLTSTDTSTATPTNTATSTHTPTSTATSTPTATEVPPTLLNDLISYWNFDEENGTRLDASGSNDLTDNNTVEYASGKIENAASFNSGAHEFLSHDDNEELSTGETDFTIAVWVYFTDLSEHRTIVNKADNSSENEYHLIYDNDAHKIRFYAYDGSWKYASDPTTISTDTWYHIVAWYDESKQEIAVSVNDSVPGTQSLSSAIEDSSAPFKVGVRYTGQLYMQGYIDELGFWKRVLTDTERSQLYNDGDGLTYPFTQSAPPSPPQAEAGTYEEDADVFAYIGNWEVHTDSNYSADHARVANSVGENVTFSFEGNRFTYYRTVGPERGITEVCIDGTDPEDCIDVNNYAEEEAFQQERMFEVLYTEHTVTLRYAGRKDEESEGYIIDLDKIVIEASTPTPEPTQHGSMSTIEVDSVSSAQTNSKLNSISWSHTINPGPDRLLVVSFGSFQEEHASVHFGGQSLTKLAETQYSSTYDRNSIWYMIDPPVGTYNVTVTLVSGQTDTITGGAVSFTGVNQSNPFGTVATTSGVSQYPSIQVSSTDGELVFDSLVNSKRTEEEPGSGQTEQWAEHTCWTSCSTNGNINAAGSTENGAASVTMSWTLAVERAFALIAAPIKPAPYPTPTFTSTPTPTHSPTPSSSTIEFDSASSSGPNSRENQISWSHTVNQGQNRLLIVSVSTLWEEHENGTVTYNGHALTYIGEATKQYQSRTSLWYMVNPPVGTHQVEITLSGQDTIIGGAASFRNVDQNDLLDEEDIETFGGYTRFPEVEISSAPGEVVYDTMSNQVRADETAGPGQTRRWADHTCVYNCDWGGNLNAAGSTKPGASTVTMAWTIPVERNTTLIAVRIKPAQPPTQTPTAWPFIITQTPQPSGTYEDTNTGATGAWDYYSGLWYQVNDTGDSGGARHASLTPLSGAQITFTGLSFDFYYRTAPSYGFAELYVDGVKVASIDQYDETGAAQQSTHVSLSHANEHVLEVRYAGRKNEDSTGTEINLDKIVVYDSATPEATTTITPTATTTLTATQTPTLTPTTQWITVGEIVSEASANNYHLEFDHEVEDGEDRMLVVSYAHLRDDGQTVYSVTYDGVPMTKAVTDTIGKEDPEDPPYTYLVGIYYLENPPVGTHEVSISLNGSDKIMAAAYTLYGVDLYNSIVDSAVRTSYNYVDLTLDIDEAGDMAVTACVVNNLSGLNFGSGQIARWQRDMSGSSWAMRAGGSTKLSNEAGTINVSSDIDPSHRVSMVGVVFRALQGDQDTPTPQSPTSTATPTPELGWSDANYSYDEIKPHAVATVDRGANGVDYFSYDDNGNMYERNENDVNWTQNFNAEGRLASITDGTDTWTFTYDGDGVRIKQENPDGSIIYFLGSGAVEIHVVEATPSVKKYYALGGQRVLRDEDEELHYMLTDHLGSVVATLNENGDLESSQRFLPFGELRDVQIGETDYGYTGQRNLADIGLMDYNARFYNPSIKRFISADTLVHSPLNPQTFNRYSYTLNNPMSFTDPSGHRPCDDQWGCEGPPSDPVEDEIENAAALYGISITVVEGGRKLTDVEKYTILKAATISGNFWRAYLNQAYLDGKIPYSYLRAWDAFIAMHGNIVFRLGYGNIYIDGVLMFEATEETWPKGDNCVTVQNVIACRTFPSISNLLHEFGHVFDIHQEAIDHGAPHDLDPIKVEEGEYLDYKNGAWYRDTRGFKCAEKSCMANPPVGDFTSGVAMREQLADMYMNLLLDGTGDPDHGFTDDKYGDARRKYMLEKQIPWILGMPPYDSWE